MCVAVPPENRLGRASYSSAGGVVSLLLSAGFVAASGRARMACNVAALTASKRERRNRPAEPKNE